MKHLDVAIAIVFHRRKVLITRRKPGGVLGGYWEFPGGKLEPGESLEDCVRRELLEELAIRVQPVMSFTPIHHSYTDRQVTLHPFLCTHESGELQLLACDELRWVEPAELRSIEFPEANRQLVEDLVHHLPNSRHDSPAASIFPAALTRNKQPGRQPATL
jgi:mutator protein MutT